MRAEDLMHGMDWDGRDLAGWFISEKLDGYRVFWDGHDLRARGGTSIDIPAEWRAGLPEGAALDGELFDAVGGLRAVGLAATYGRFTVNTQFMVFDAPGPGALVDRIVRACVAVEGRPFAISVRHTPVRSTEKAVAILRDVKAQGGEGVVARHPSLRYVPGRTRGMLKLKEVPA